MILPSIYNNQLGRGGPEGITDVFGIGWEWVASAGGSIVRPGEPLLKNVNEWTDKIKIPDIDTWDWAAEAEKTKCDCRVSTQATLLNGFWFERLISFMDFAPAAMALIDDEQKDAVKSLFAEMTDLACKLVDKFAHIGRHSTDSISMTTGRHRERRFSRRTLRMSCLYRI